MFEDDDSPFLTIDETAELLRIRRRTLDNLRWKDKGPPARRHGTPPPPGAVFVLR